LRRLSKYVSNVLYRLGVVCRKKLHGLTLVYASKDLLEESCKRIGVTHHTQVTQVQKNGRKFLVRKGK